MLIYKGKFTNGKTNTVGMIMYQNGDIYYGQLKQMVKNGVGKLIQFNGGFLEGTWDQDKLNGMNCRIYDANSGDLFVG